MYPLVGPVHEAPEPPGYTYAAVLVRLESGPSGRHCTREDVLAALGDIRFSGWLTQPEGGWLVAVAAAGNGTIGAGRRGVVGVGEWLADRLGATVLAIRVIDDRQLLLVSWVDGAELGRYVSDPSYGLDPDDDTLPDPLGVEHAAAFAVACGRSAAADELTELLAEELDPDSVIESERLATVVGLLGLPGWLVAVPSLPHDIPTGPRAREVTRLGAGRSGLLGRLCGRAVDVVLRRRPPPPPIIDAPRGRAEIDPGMLW